MTALIIIVTGFALLSLVSVVDIGECNQKLNEEYRNEINA